MLQIYKKCNIETTLLGKKCNFDLALLGAGVGKIALWGMW